MDAGSLEGLVLKEITPTPEEEENVNRVARELLEKVAIAARELGQNIEPLIVGSVAKGTFLRDPDIDLFIQFPTSTSREALEQQGLALGMKVLPHGRKQYAEHPYVQGEFRGFDAEIVPCFGVTDPSQKMSAVDRTPFHTRFIAANLGPQQKGEVRLLKRFFKGIGAYGAEEAVRGFSGYLSELLVIRYCTFRGVVEASARWPESMRLDAGVAPASSHSVATHGEPLVFVDPVDPTRNVASALSTEKYALFIHASQSYLAEPSRLFFFPNPPAALPLAALRSQVRPRGTELLGILLHTPQVIPDIYYSQLRKFERAVRALCEENGFAVLHSAFFELGKQTLFLFEFEVFRLPAVRSHRGPPVGNPREKEFHAKWMSSPQRRGAVHIVDGLWAVDVAREFTAAEHLIRDKMSTLSLGKHLNEEVKKGFKMLRGPSLFTRAHALPLTLFLDKRYPWEW
jgi:tRNA nucleotidyltransferase (CCA-adding enzyme)